MPEESRERLTLRVHGMREEGTEDGATRVRLLTDRGDIVCRLHAAEGDAGIVWVFGAGGGLGGPAGGVYTRLAQVLAPEAISSLRVDYRRPGVLEECVLDTMAGIAYLEARGIGQVALVGHSFGGAVVINVGVVSDAVTGVVAMSSQTAGAGAVVRLSPKPLLLLHGTGDEVLPDRCSRSLYDAAGDPKELILYPGCGHGLDDCRDALDEDLLRWLRAHLLSDRGVTEQAA